MFICITLHKHTFTYYVNFKSTKPLLQKNTGHRLQVNGIQMLRDNCFISTLPVIKIIRLISHSTLLYEIPDQYICILFSTCSPLRNNSKIYFYWAQKRTTRLLEHFFLPFQREPLTGIITRQRKHFCQKYLHFFLPAQLCARCVKRTKNSQHYR